ncbi:MAG: hypothetical protein AAF841_05930 [Pseudomonadota bacterium]
MLDTLPLNVTHRSSIHLKDKSSTALTDEIALARHCFAAELRHGPAEIHAACLLPHALYLLWSLDPADDPVDRLQRFTASFTKHSHARPDWIWPITAPLTPGFFDETLREFLEMPVAWGLCERAEDWPYSSLRRASSNRHRHQSS